MRFIYTKTFIRGFVLFCAIALFIISDATGVNGQIKNVFNKSYGLLAKSVGGASGSLKNFFATVFTIKNLAKDNAQLSQQVNELSFENARLQSAKAENSALRRALNFSETSSLNLIPVQVLTADPSGFAQTIIVDTGAASEIRENAPVITAPGLLVGKVSRIYPTSAQVTLITSPAVLINAEASESGAKGIVTGNHGLSLIFDLVTQNELIKAGDRIITSGLSEDFPKGLLIGEISGIRSSASDLFQTAFITPAADLRNIKFLFVVK